MSLLTVIAVSEVKQDNGSKGEKRNYKTIGFRTPNTKVISGLNIRCKTKEGVVNAWEKSYLDNKMGFGFDFQVDDMVEGDIVTREVSEYPIVTSEGEERMVSTYSCVVFGDTSDPSFEIEVQKAFKAAGHPIVSEPVKQKSVVVASSAVKDEVFA